jgi:hypothetical protein
LHGIGSSDNETPNKEIQMVKVNRLLDIRRLKTEAQQLEDGLRLIQSQTQRDHTLDKTLQVAQAIMTQSATDIQLDNILSGSNLLAWTDEHAKCSLMQLITSSEIMSNCILETEKLTLLGGAIQLHACRSLITFFHWQINIAPDLAQTLFRSSVFNDDLEEIRQNFPAFANLVEAIYHYASFLQTHHPNKKRKGSSELNVDSLHVCIQANTLKSTSFVEDNEENLNRVSLSDIIPRTKSNGHVLLPKVQPNGTSKQALFTTCVDMIQRVWSDHIICPGMKPFYQFFNSPARNSRDSEGKLASIKACSVIRGAILSTISSMLGDDAIMASQEMRNVIMAPGVLFGATRDTVLANSIYRDFRNTMAPLINCVESLLKQSPGIAEAACRIGDAVFHGLVTITSAKPGPRQKFLIPFTLPVQPSGLPKRRSRKQASRETKLPPHQSLSTALEDVQAPYWGMLGLILREALNERRGLQAGNANLFNLLCGLHATQGAGNKPQDRNLFDPIRAHSNYAKLVAKHLPPIELTQPHGLSNLLVWMGSGQSALTTVFLDKYGACSKNLSECIHKFHQVAIHNSNLEGFHTFRFKPLHSQLQLGFIPVDNIKVWGVPCNQLRILDYKADPETYHDQIKTRLEPYWKDEYQQSWTNFLGDLASQDPLSYTGELRTWEEAFKFIADLNLSPFGSKALSLTGTQLCNNLVIAGICSPPTLDSLGNWIWIHKTLGAYRGLELMGFHCTTRNATIKAFECVYDHLDHHLSQTDRVALGFDSIFLEHALCKVQRWTFRLEQDANISLRRLGIEAAEKEQSIQDDNSSFPFPLLSEQEILQNILCG